MYSQTPVNDSKCSSLCDLKPAGNSLCQSIFWFLSIYCLLWLLLLISSHFKPTHSANMFFFYLFDKLIMWKYCNKTHKGILLIHLAWQITENSQINKWRTVTKAKASIQDWRLTDCVGENEMWCTCLSLHSHQISTKLCTCEIFWSDMFNCTMATITELKMREHLLKEWFSFVLRFSEPLTIGS